MIKFVVYTSKTSGALSNIELNNLVTEARHNNKNNQITGILLYIDTIFLHYFEGNEESVDTLYEKISGDPRHNSLKLLKSGKTQSKKYENWQMLFKKTSFREINQLLKNNKPYSENPNGINLNYLIATEIFEQLTPDV